MTGKKEDWQLGVWVAGKLVMTYNFLRVEI